MSPGSSTLNESQISELRETAECLLVHNAWDSLSWDDAWAGERPDYPSKSQIDEELNTLIEKATRIMDSGSIEDEFEGLAEHLRMIYLESCSTIKLYSSNNGS